MLFKSFHWLSHHGISAIVSCSNSMVSVIWVLLFLSYLTSVRFLYIGGVFKKEIIALMLVQLDMIQVISNARS